MLNQALEPVLAKHLLCLILSLHDSVSEHHQCGARFEPYGTGSEREALLEAENGAPFSQFAERPSVKVKWGIVTCIDLGEGAVSRVELPIEHRDEPIAGRIVDQYVVKEGNRLLGRDAILHLRPQRSSKTGHEKGG